MRRIYIALQWISIIQILSTQLHISSGITIYFSNNGGNIAGAPLSISQNDFSDGWDSLFARFKTEIPVVVKPQSMTENWEEYKLYDSNGTMLESTNDLVKYDQQYIYIVPENRYFYWPHVRPGHRAYMENIVPGRTIVLESITESPRIFLIHNLFDEEEADALVNNALSLSGHNALHRSTTGDGNSGADGERTSDNAWDSESSTALAISERMFAIVSMPYEIVKMDGLQIVRYNQKQAYRHHYDYFPMGCDGPDKNYDASTGGANRYATLFAYLSDVEEGGQTMFPNAQVLPDTILDEIEPDLARLLSSHKEYENVSSKITDLFEHDSWQYEMAKQCYNVLTIKPKKATAVLFYDFTADWKVDPMSLHGGCPVLDGIKWGANSWIWNDPKPEDEAINVDVEFTNKFQKEGTLLWMTHPLVNVMPGEISSHGTFHKHVFRFEIDGITVWKHQIDKNNGLTQQIDITPESNEQTYMPIEDFKHDEL